MEANEKQKARVCLSACLSHILLGGGYCVSIFSSSSVSRGLILHRFMEGAPLHLARCNCIRAQRVGSDDTASGEQLGSESSFWVHAEDCSVDTCSYCLLKASWEWLKLCRFRSRSFFLFFPVRAGIVICSFLFSPGGRHKQHLCDCTLKNSLERHILYWAPDLTSVCVWHDFSHDFILQLKKSVKLHRRLFYFFALSCA